MYGLFGLASAQVRESFSLGFLVRHQKNARCLEEEADMVAHLQVAYMYYLVVSGIWKKKKKESAL